MTVVSGALISGEHYFFPSLIGDIDSTYPGDSRVLCLVQDPLYPQNVGFPVWVNRNVIAKMLFPRGEN